MPKGSTTKLEKEIYEAVLSMESSFTLDKLVQKIDENRGIRGECGKASRQSVERILVELYLLFSVSKTPNGGWKKGATPINGTIKFQSEIVDKIISDAKIEGTAFDVGQWIELGAKGPTRKAYICYPYRDNPFWRSMELLVLLTHLYPIAKEDFAPATPHEMYWRLEENVDRKTAMDKCAELIAKCEFVLFCMKKGSTPSAGMKQDIEAAAVSGKEIKYIEDLLGYYPNIAEIMKKSGLSSSVNGEALICQEIKVSN
jgi:hypothetical protein